MPDFTNTLWRTGRRVGRHMYAQLGPEPSDSDPPIGTLDTAEIAAEACEAHNEALARRTAGLRLRGSHGVQFGDGSTQFNVF